MSKIRCFIGDHKIYGDKIYRDFDHKIYGDFTGDFVHKTFEDFL